MITLPNPEVMIVICTIALIAYTAHVMDKAFAWSKQFEAVLKMRERIIDLEVENAKLRELMKDIYVQFDSTIDWPDIERRMRELGVEVETE